MLVSTRAATLVEILARPSSRLGLRGTSPALSPPLPGGRLVEQPEPFVRPQNAAHRAGWNDPDHVARRRPLDLVAGLDVVGARNRLGERHLQLAGDLCHVL